MPALATSPDVRWHSPPQAAVGKWAEASELADGLLGILATPMIRIELLRLQAWFLENLERRLGVGREKMLGVYEDVLQSHAPPARAAAAARSPAQTHLAAALRTGSGIASPYRGGRSYPDSEEEI